MTPAFGFSGHNERIKYVYGNYNFWSWLRYWYLDSCNLVSMIMVDKGYFDYDYERVESPIPVVNWEDTVKSDEEVADMLAMFGMRPKKPQTLEEIQNHIIKQESYGS